MIYPVDSAILRLNNRGQKLKCDQLVVLHNYSQFSQMDTTGTGTDVCINGQV